MPIDPNLVTAQWSFIGAFGVAVSLLTPKAAEYRNAYLESGEDHDRTRDKQWGNLVRVTPAVVFVGVCGLSALGAVNAGLSFTTKSTEQVLLLIAPIIAQLGFWYLIVRLIPDLGPLIEGNLERFQSELPRTTDSSTITNITVVNNSDHALQMWSISDRGALEALTNEGKPLEFDPLGKISQRTYGGHCFLLRTRDKGLSIGTVKAKDRPSRVEITKPDVERVIDEPQGAKTTLLPPRPLLSSLYPKLPTVITVRIDNKSDRTLLMWWITAHGEPKGLGPNGKPDVTIAPRDQRERTSRDGARWLFRTNDGIDIGIVEAKDSPTWTEITQNDIDRALAQPGG